MRKAKVLLVDDEEAVRFGIREYLVTSGFTVIEARSCSEGQALFDDPDLDAAIVDYSLPDGTAMDLLKVAQAAGTGIPTIVLTGHGSVDLAVQCLKEGAEHFLTKPVDLPSLLVVLDRAVELQRVARLTRADRSRSPAEYGPFLGSSPAILELVRQARRVAPSNLPVLILGETGSGKGVLARWIHSISSRSREPYVDLNCAGLARDLLESELFGHERGAFTGAVASKPGLVEAANRGTMFLDEIGDMELAVQPKLLKVIEEKRFRRLGEVRDRSVSVRFVAATHRHLSVMVKEGGFREDLFFRLNTVTLDIPPLRERPDDVPLVARQILQQLASDMRRQAPRISPEGEEMLRLHSWPGNIRELRNVLERALLVESDVIGPGSLAPLGSTSSQTFQPPPPPEELSGTLLEVETQYIRQVLRQEGGSVERASARLGIPRSTLYQKVKRYKLHTPTNLDQ